MTDTAQLQRESEIEGNRIGLPTLLELLEREERAHGLDHYFGRDSALMTESEENSLY